MNRATMLCLVAVILPSAALAEGQLTWGRAPNGEFLLAPAPGADPASVYQNMKQLAATDGVGLCSGITVPTDRFDCFQKVAEVADQPDLCGHIGTSGVVAAQATGNCYAVLAVQRGDRALCSRIPSEAPFSLNNCLLGIAVKTGDIRPCEDMVSRGLPGPLDCLQEVIRRAGSGTDCSRLTKTALADSCYQELASEFSNPSYCEKVQGPSSRDFCFGQMARRLGDWSLCDQIRSEDSRERCTRELRILDLKDGKFCYDLPSDDAIADCFIRLAREKNDPALCEETLVKEAGGGSPGPPPVVTDEPSAPDPWLGSRRYEARDVCYQQMAELRLDPELCLKVVRPSKRDRCFESLASKKLDADLCVAIGDPNMRDRCVLEVAVRKNDRQLCDRIRDASIRQRCLDQVGTFDPELQPIPDAAIPPGMESVGGSTWEPYSETVPQDVYEACLAKAAQFTRDCDEVGRRWSKEDCRRSNHQSGCALWSVSCFSPYTPGQVFSGENCARPGFAECATAAYPGYVSCTDSCNTAEDRAGCRQERCQKQAEHSIKPCGTELSRAPGWEEPSGGPPAAQPGSAPWAKSATGASASADATLTDVADDVAVVRAGRRTQLAAGDSLQPGDEIATGSGSAEVTLDGGHKLKAGPNTRVQLDPANRSYRLGIGSLLLRFFQLRQRHQVITPTAVAGIRGTELLMITDPAARLDRVLVREGTVEVQGRTSGQVALRGGQQVEVRDGVVGQARPLSATDWSAAAERLEPSATPGGTPQVVTAPEAPAEPSRGSGAGGCQAILGIWKWFNGSMVECLSDGRCLANNGFSGPWKCLDGSGRFEIQWSRPGQQVPYVDTLTVSADGWEISGLTQSGQGVSAQRPDFTSGPAATGCDAIVGTWLWFGGRQVECSAGGTCTSSAGHAGPWRCVTPPGRFEIRWGRPGRPDEFIDNLVISPLGSYLEGRNQHGVATGGVRQ